MIGGGESFFGVSESSVEHSIFLAYNPRVQAKIPYFTN